ncbi:hypothetical protein [Marinicrinis sediminis]|uniref:Uncharacterized protein n=1 Tax=Marinicrinis sediminis TaxID=1652465 RepID=A0ABW5RE79_9BACL
MMKKFFLTPGLIFILVLSTVFPVSAHESPDTTEENYLGISEESILAENLRFRKDFGLDSDKTKVINTIKEKPKNNSFKQFGAYLTDLELEELDTRFKKEKQAIPKIKAKLKPELSWLYVDQPNGGIINIGIKDLSKLNEQEKKEIYNDYIENKVLFKKAKFTEEELNQAHLDIINNLSAVEEEGIKINSISVDIPNEALDIGIYPNTKGSQKTLNKMFSSVPLKFFEQQIDNIDDSSRTSYHRPLQGGLAINTSATSFVKCTASFTALMGLVIIL